MNSCQITSNQTTAGFDIFLEAKLRTYGSSKDFLFLLILLIKLCARSYKDRKITFNESQHIEIYGNYYIKGGKKNPGHVSPRISPKHRNVRSEWEPWSVSGHQGALMSEVVSSAGRKNNKKGSEKSTTYFTYSTILLFKESSRRWPVSSVG